MAQTTPHELITRIWYDTFGFVYIEDMPGFDPAAAMAPPTAPAFSQLIELPVRL